MENVVVQAPGGSYNITFGARIWEQINQFAGAYDQALVVSDTTVAPLYANRLSAPQCSLPPGEGQKTLDTVQILAEDWLKRGLSRHSLVIALGGGVVGDLVGLAAALYQRGIAYILVPTTLLAQVESGVGGKTGVNTPQGKNAVGAFYQPWGIFIDPAVLKTLPAREITNGLAEILKYGIAAAPALFEVVRNRLAAFYDLDLKVVGPVIRYCCQLKSDIVSDDERAPGSRKVLSYGHTFGYALQAAGEYELYTHGEAVLLGMLLEANLARLLGMLSESSLAEITGVIRNIGLKEGVANLSAAQLLQALPLDHLSGGEFAFMLPQRVGKVVEVLLSPQEVAEYWPRVLQL